MAFVQSGEVLRTDSVFCSAVTEIGGRTFTCENLTSNIGITFEDAITGFVILFPWKSQESKKA
ncbi:MAG: hypothetical protein LBF49_00820 [Puniceicoccales bacterium]|nr:hypothetical protein [Puniceicoccales bacterium]